MSQNDGGPAFPNPRTKQGKASLPGMSLRDYFAAVALQGVLTGTLLEHCQTDGNTNQDKVAKDAYVIANAMLTAREQP